MMNTDHTTQRGFTLVEMVIVIGVAALFATLLIVQFVQTRESRELDAARELVVEDLRTVTTWARSGKVVAGGADAPVSYGAQFEPGTPTYTLFADVDGDGLYTGTVDTEERVVNLQDGEGLNNMVLESCFPVDALGLCTVAVTVPDGGVLTNGSSTADLTLTFLHQRSEELIGVILSVPSGRIE